MSRRDPSQPGLNLHVYPSEMVQESRIYRISRALQDTGLFTQTHLVGIVGEHQAGSTVLDDGRVIHRIGSDDSPGEGFVDKARSRLRWFGAVVASYSGADVSVVNAHSVWTLPSCWLLAKRTGAKLVYNTHELETETPTMVGRKKRIAQLIERALIRSCDVVCVVNAPIADWYQRAYEIPRPVVARNIPVAAQATAAPVRDKVGIAPSDRLFIHTGRITGGRHVTEILATFAEGPPDAHVVFLGDGELRPEVEAASKRSANIHWLPPVAHDEVVPHVVGADASLCLIDTSALSYRLSTPNKMFEALSARTPVLCSDLPGAEELIGPALWPDWHITDVAKELPQAIEAIDAERIARFRAGFEGLPTWDDEAVGLIEAYRAMLSPHT